MTSLIPRNPRPETPVDDEDIEPSQSEPRAHSGTFKSYGRHLVRTCNDPFTPSSQILEAGVRIELERGRSTSTLDAASSSSSGSSFPDSY